MSEPRGGSFFGVATCPPAEPTAREAGLGDLARPSRGDDRQLSSLVASLSLAPLVSTSV